MLNAGTGSVENVLNILQRLCSLLSSGLARQFAGGRINAQLAGYEHEAIGLHRLTVCAQRGRRLGSGYGFHLFAHIVLLLILGAPTCCGRRRYTSPPATTNRTISNDWQCRLRSSLLSKVAFSAHDARHTAINRLFLAIPDDSRRFQTIPDDSATVLAKPDGFSTTQASRHHRPCHCRHQHQPCTRRICKRLPAVSRKPCWWA